MAAKIVILDGSYANPGDLTWEPITEIGETTIYDQTTEDQVIERSKDADIVVINKIKFEQKHFENLPNLKLLMISATGTDNVDLKSAEKHDVEVENIDGYSTHSVAQHTYALILSLFNRISAHETSVKNGDWNEEKGFSYTLKTIPELYGKKLGVYGFGKIGHAVAQIGKAFGMKILVVSNHASGEDYPFFQFVSLKELFRQSNIISLHTPLRKDNFQIIDHELLKLVQPDTILINTARGGLIAEDDLADALKNNTLAGAALDVLQQEPPPKDHPLLTLDNCIVTPHMAWTSFQARKNLIEQVAMKIRDFIEQNGL